MSAAASLLQGKQVVFWVCSDEGVAADAFPGLRVEPGVGTILEDLCSLARCDLLIGPPSTFSAWASYYGRVPLYSMVDSSHMPTLEEFVIAGS
jgi:hypothetical protein